MMQLQPHALHEPVIVEDIYVSELGGIEDAGDGNIRYTFCARQVSTYDHVTVETVVKVRLVSGPTLIWFTIRATFAYFGMRCCEVFMRCMALH